MGVYFPLADLADLLIWPTWLPGGQADLDLLGSETHANLA